MIGRKDDRVRVGDKEINTSRYSVSNGRGLVYLENLYKKIKVSR
jgi:hypothetical protein